MTYERFTPEARRVMENALRQALLLGHSYIGTEHIRLALAQPVNVVPPDPEGTVPSTHSPEPSMDSPDAIHLPRGVRLHSVHAFAETWEAYDRLPWQERATFDQQTGDRHPHKETRWSSGSITVFPPVNVPRDGEFGVRRELVQ